MSDLGNIVKKEVREMLTPATIVPVILMAFLFGTMGNMVGGITEEAKKKPTIGIINEDNSHLSEIVTEVLNAQAKVVYSSTNSADTSEGLREVGEEGGVALLVIHSDFSENIYENRPGEIHINWIMSGMGTMDIVPSQIVNVLIQVINQEISKNLVEENSPVNPEIVINPVAKTDTTILKGKEIRGLSPEAISGMVSSQSFVVPFVMMMIIIMAGGMVISSMGMEKENKTLETLLTLPVKRNYIVIGKIAGSAIVGFLMAAIYMVGFGYYMQSFQISGVNLADFGLALGPQDYFLVGLSVFLTLLAGLSLCMVLGTFAKDYKSAQTLMLPITFLVMIPMFFIIFKDFDTIPVVFKVILFAIPFSHPMMAMRALMFDDYLLVLGGILYVVAFAAVVIAVVVRVFRTDRLLTERTKKRRVGARVLRGMFGRFGR
jgi:ABC-2 type transport system permease protein